MTKNFDKNFIRTSIESRLNELNDLLNDESVRNKDIQKEEVFTALEEKSKQKIINIYTKLNGFSNTRPEETLNNSDSDDIISLSSNSSLDSLDLLDSDSDSSSFNSLNSEQPSSEGITQAEITIASTSLILSAFAGIFSENKDSAKEVLLQGESDFVFNYSIMRNSETNTNDFTPDETSQLFPEFLEATKNIISETARSINERNNQHQNQIANQAKEKVSDGLIQ